MTCYGQIQKKTRHKIGLKVSVESVIHSMRMLFKTLLKNLTLILLFAVIKFKKMVMSFLEAVSW